MVGRVIADRYARQFRRRFQLFRETAQARGIPSVSLSGASDEVQKQPYSSWHRGAPAAFTTLPTPFSMG
jgi:hypothetical protein